MFFENLISQDQNRPYYYTYVLNNPLIYTDPSGYSTKDFIDHIVSIINGSAGVNSWTASGGFQNGAPTLSNGNNDASGGGASWGGGSGNMGGYSYTSYSGGWSWVIGVSEGKERKFWRYNKNRRNSTGTNWVASWSTPNFDQSGLWGSSSSFDGFGGLEYSSPGGSCDGATKAGEPNIYRLPVYARIAITLSGKVPIHFPDAVGWTPLNVDLVGVAGTEISVSSKINIINGPDKGQSIKVNLDIATSVGWDQGISGIRTEYYFFGSYDNFSAEDFFGERINASIGASFGIEVGYGVTYMKVDGGVIVGISRHIGFSPPGFSGNINKGESYGW